MKIPNERELQQIAINYSSVSDFKDYKPVGKKKKKKKTAETYQFLISDTTFVLYDPLCFWQLMKELEMKCHTMLTEKMQKYLHYY